MLRSVRDRLFFCANDYVSIQFCSNPLSGKFSDMHFPRHSLHLSNPKPGHTTGGSGRGARRSSRAGSHRIGCQQNYSPGKQMSIILWQRRFNVSQKAQTGEILGKPTEEQNQRLTTGLSAVYHRDEKRALFLAADQWNDAFLSLYIIFMQSMSKNNKVHLSNPKPGPTTGGSSRSARRSGRARSGKIGPLPRPVVFPSAGVRVPAQR